MSNGANLKPPPEELQAFHRPALLRELVHCSSLVRASVRRGFVLASSDDPFAQSSTT
jgi:hypothetical protein